MKHHENRIDYIELPATDILATKTFYAAVFGWKFTDYGPDYTSFEDGRLGGGFTKESKVTPRERTSARVVRTRIISS